MLKSTWIPFTWAQNLNKLEILEEIGTIASQISKKVEFIPRLRSGELSSIFASASDLTSFLNLSLDMVFSKGILHFCIDF